MVIKIRTGFVSNSSSTAFICELTTQIEVSDNFDNKIYCGKCNKLMSKSGLKEWFGKKFDKKQRVFVFAEIAMALTGELSISEVDAQEEFRLIDTIPVQVADRYCPFCSGDKVSFYERYLFLLGNKKPADIDKEFLAKQSKRANIKDLIHEEYI